MGWGAACVFVFSVTGISLDNRVIDRKGRFGQSNSVGYTQLFVSYALGMFFKMGTNRRPRT